MSMVVWCDLYAHDCKKPAAGQGFCRWALSALVGPPPAPWVAFFRSLRFGRARGDVPRYDARVRRPGLDRRVKCLAGAFVVLPDPAMPEQTPLLPRC